METLYALRETAKNDPNKRALVLILDGGRVHNATFIDPWLGLLEFRDLPGKTVLTREIGELTTTGLFID